MKDDFRGFRGEINFGIGNGGNNHIWTGILILLIGVTALVKATVTNVPHWVFSWQMLLVVLGLFIGLKHRFRGAAWFILLLVGWVFLIQEIVPDLSLRRYLWPVALIALGGFLIWRSRRRKGWQQNDEIKNFNTDAETNEKARDAYSSEDFIRSTSFFGGTKKNIISKNFKGGDLINIFGGTELDLSRADINGTAVIDLTTIFGGTELVVPSDWAVKSEAVTIFGGLEDNRNAEKFIGNSGKLLLLKGTVIFGGIEVKSY